MKQNEIKEDLVGIVGESAVFEDPKIDRQIDEAGRVVDRSGVGGLYERIDGEVYAEAPWIYLYYPVAYQAVSPRVTGYRMPVVYLGADYANVHKKPR